MNKLVKQIPLSENNPVHQRYGHRCYQFETTGLIEYDPDRNKKQEKVQPHWCIAKTDPDLTRYYRKLFFNKFGITLKNPSYDSHLSILKGDYTPKMDTDWNYLNGLLVSILYDPNLYWNESHVWLNVYCSQYFDIREFYSIPAWNTKDFGHITVGKFSAN